MNTIKDIIVHHPFARGLDPAYLNLLTECATYERYETFEQLFHESFDADRFYLIHNGAVRLQIFVPEQGIVTVQTVESNQALGWSWLFPPYRWLFSATTIKPTDAIVFRAKFLRHSMDENHDFGYAIAMRVGELLSERLHTTCSRLAQSGVA